MTAPLTFGAFPLGMAGGPDGLATRPLQLDERLADGPEIIGSCSAKDVGCLEALQVESRSPLTTVQVE